MTSESRAESMDNETDSTGRTAREAHVILGPRTRLARTLRDRPELGSPTRFVVARSAEEVDGLAADWPGAEVLIATESLWTRPRGFERVVVVCCAIGPCHAREIRSFRESAAAVARDLEFVSRILAAEPDARVHVVLASTVLALARPRASRLGYAGFKYHAEAGLRGMVEGRERASFSAFHPGRLVELRSLRRPATLLHSTYEAVSRGMVRDIAGDRGRRVISGLDARLILLGRAVEMGFRSLFGG